MSGARSQGDFEDISHKPRFEIARFRGCLLSMLPLPVLPSLWEAAKGEEGGTETGFLASVDREIGEKRMELRDRLLLRTAAMALLCGCAVYMGDGRAWLYSRNAESASKSRDQETSRCPKGAGSRRRKGRSVGVREGGGRGGKGEGGEGGRGEEREGGWTETFRRAVRMNEQERGRMRRSGQGRRERESVLRIRSHFRSARLLFLHGEQRRRSRGGDRVLGTCNNAYV
eukprot:3539902-Pleurochrysis_carterae.AAC.1